MKHEIMPVFDGKSRILILGSFPSEASRKQGFYYGHPRNRFWRVISGVLGCGVGATGARKANVPSSAKSIVVPSIIVGAVCVLAAGVATFLKADIADIIANAFSGIFCANVSLSAQRIVKALERI